MTLNAAEKQPAPVRVVLFDAVGTLIRPHPAVAAAYELHARRRKIFLPREEIQTRFSAAFARQESIDEQHGFITSEGSERERWREIVREVFHETSDTEGLFADLWEHFADPQSWQVFDDVAECLTKLRSRGLLLGLASNFDRRLEKIAAALPGLEAVSHVFTSSQLGHRKPSLNFFRAVEATLQASPQQITFVGDDEANDYRGATAAGWRAIPLDRSGEINLPGSIATLRELPLG